MQNAPQSGDKISQKIPLTKAQIPKGSAPMDLPLTSETEKLLQGLVGVVDIFVVGHHGSETSSSQGLLDEIKPRYGLISSQGPNKGGYNNPDLEVLKRLETLGTVMYATYRSGTIVATIDGGVIKLSPPANERITPSNYREAA